MRTIVHISDLHFGRVHKPALEPLIRTVAAIKPDLVAVSGDLTQRASIGQFREARAFLKALPSPKIIVPGNHDMPLYNIVLRLFWPLARFRRYITNDLTPMFIDREIAVQGINTTRVLVGKGGRVNSEQVSTICEHFEKLRRDQTRIVVTHHPFDLPPGHEEDDLVGRARMTMKLFRNCGADLFLSGHLHRAHIGSTARYKIEGYSALVIQAGTAISARKRGEENSFNLIRIAAPEITIERHAWRPDGAIFELFKTERFKQTEAGWVPA